MIFHNCHHATIQCFSIRTDAFGFNEVKLAFKQLELPHIYSQPFELLHKHQSVLKRYYNFPYDKGLQSFGLSKLAVKNNQILASLAFSVLTICHVGFQMGQTFRVQSFAAPWSARMYRTSNESPITLLIGARRPRI